VKAGKAVVALGDRLADEVEGRVLLAQERGDAGPPVGVCAKQVGAVQVAEPVRDLLASSRRPWRAAIAPR